jgi:hypothetical protein
MNIATRIRSRRTRRLITGGLVAALALAIAVPALADVVKNDIVVGGNDTVVAGATTTVKYHIKNNPGGRGDYDACDATPESPATVTLSVPAAVTASTTSLVFTACETPQSVTFSSDTPGNYPISVSNVEDDYGHYDYAEASFTLTVTAPVVDEPTLTAPALTLPGDFTVEAAGSTTVVSFDASAEDENGPVDVTCDPASGSAFALGTTTVNCSATNGAGETKGSFKVHVRYAWSGILQPINANDTSVFKAGSTIPVKFRLTGASAGHATAVATIAFVKVADDVYPVGGVDENVIAATPTEGVQFRYDTTDEQYIYNYRTSKGDNGQYRFHVTFDDGTKRRSPLVTIR